MKVEPSPQDMGKNVYRVRRTEKDYLFLEITSNEHDGLVDKFQEQNEKQWTN